MDRNGEPTNAAQKRSLDGLRRRYPTEPSVDEALTRRMRKRERTGARYSSPSLETVEARLARFLAGRIEGPVAVRNHPAASIVENIDVLPVAVILSSGTRSSAPGSSSWSRSGAHFAPVTA